MQRILLLVLIFTCATASAQIYRRIGPDGQVYFSDRPGPDAEQIEVTPNTAVRLPPVSGQELATDQQEGGDAEQQGDTTSAYSYFSIVSPASNEGVRANDGNVTVVLALLPKLQPDHTIALRIDGEDGEDVDTGGSLAFELNNLSRGLHTVEATVLDEDGNELIQTRPVSFNVLRAALGGG